MAAEFVFDAIEFDGVVDRYVFWLDRPLAELIIVEGHDTNEPFVTIPCTWEPSSVQCD